MLLVLSQITLVSEVSSLSGFNREQSISIPNTELHPITPPETYSLTEDGLYMHILKPGGKIITKDGTNNVLGDGSTFNGTETILYVQYISLELAFDKYRYGSVTLELLAPTVPGVVTAFILLGNSLPSKKIDS